MRLALGSTLMPVLPPLPHAGEGWGEGGRLRARRLWFAASPSPSALRLPAHLRARRLREWEPARCTP